MAESAPKKTVNLGDLTLPQLGSLKQQLDQVRKRRDVYFSILILFIQQEIEMLSNSIQQLSTARNKFQESGECVKKQSTVKENTSVMVPLTGSMYVPGNIINKDTFLIDVGTGYFVEKDTKTSIEFFTRKVNFLNEQLENYVKMVQEKAYLRDQIHNLIRIATQQLQAAQA